MNDAWGFPNETTREKAYQSINFAVPSKEFNETYYFRITWDPLTSAVANLPYTTAGTDRSLSSNDMAMRKGVLKRIIYPTGGFVDFDFEANSYKQNFPYHDESYSLHNNEMPQACGGLRVRSISYFERGGKKPVSQKYYTYGEYEEGTGEMANRPTFNLFGKKRNMEAVDVVQYIANWSTNCGDYSPCDNRSSLKSLSIDKKTTLYPASILDYSYANGSVVYYTKVTEYSIDRGISTGKKVYSYYPPYHFYPPYNDWGRIPETLISYIKTTLFLGAQKSISEFEFISPSDWKLKNRRTFEYQKQMRAEEIPVAYSTFRIVHTVRAGVWPHSHIELYDDKYSPPDISLDELGGEYTCGTYGIPAGKLLLSKETEEHFENGESTVTINDYTYKRLQPSEIKTTKSNGDRYSKYLMYSFDLDGVYDQMESKNMLEQVIQERIVNTTSVAELMRRKTNYAVKTDNGGILPHTVEVSYNGGSAVVETTYDKYDQYGNILQLTGKDQMPVSYLWGYWGLYPVAQLKGVSYSQIPTKFLSNVKINNPGTDAELRSLLHELKDSFPGQVQFRGYTYKRLTGLSSHIDEKGAVSYYDYDPYGRLTSVKDHNQHMIENYSYRMVNSPKKSLVPFYVNTPIMATIYNDIIAYERSYNVIMPGGEIIGLSTDLGNIEAENEIKSGYGIHLYPDDNDAVPTASIFLDGYYDPNYNPTFPSRVDIDFIKDEHVVFTTTIPLNTGMSPWKRTVLYLPPGDYQISIRLDPFNQYDDTGFAVNIFGLKEGSSEIIDNYSTITLEAGKKYEFMYYSLM